jgi:hypothetical protein
VWEGLENFRPPQITARSLVQEKENKVLNLIKQLRRDYTRYLINTIYSKVSLRQHRKKVSAKLLCFCLLLFLRSPEQQSYSVRLLKLPHQLRLIFHLVFMVMAWKGGREGLDEGRKSYRQDGKS